jgi:hypothetical protein
MQFLRNNDDSFLLYGGIGSQPFCFVKKGTTFFFCWKVVDNTLFFGIDR